MSSSRPDLRSLKRRLAGLRDHLAADLAVRQGKLRREDLERGLEAAEDEGGDLGRILEEAGAIPPGLLEACAAEVRIEDLRRLVAPGALPEEVRDAASDPARKLGRYLLGREIGRGGMGVVYRAWQEDLGRWVALKMLRPEAVGLAVARFVQEARLAAQVTHPNLVAIYEVGQERGIPFLAMALLEGGSLDGARLPHREAAAAVRTAAEAAAEIHRHGIVHRDIKPGNLLRDAQGRLHLGDFGLARGEAGARLSVSGTMVGTLGFAAPEQIRGRHSEIGPRSDVYALGATLFALVAGRPPFEGPDVVTVAQRATTEEAPPLPGAPRDLDTICRRAMAKRPEQRYSSAAELADDLRRFLEGEPVKARPEGTLRRAARRAARRPAWIVAAALAALTAILALSPRRSGPDSADPEAIRKADLARRAVARAKELLSGGRPRIAEAHEALRQALTAEDVVAAEAWFLMGEYDRAERILRSLPNDPEARRLLGALLLERAAWDLGCGTRPSPKSVDEAESLLGKPSRTAEVFRLLLAGNATEAERTAAAEIEAGAADVTFEILRGMARLYLGNSDAAEADFTQALRHAPGRALAWYGRATARERKRNLAEAAEDFERAYELRPSYVMALRNRANVQRRAGQPEGAIETLERARRAAPDDPGIATDRIYVLATTGRTTEALAEADALVAKRPDEPTAHVARASVLHLAGNIAGAIEEYTAALKLNPDWVPALAGRGELRVSQGAHVAAEEDLTRAVELQPASRDLGVWLSWRAKARANRLDWEGAYQDYDRTVRLLPEDAGLLFNRGIAALNCGRREQARRDLEESIRRRPDLEAAGRPFLESLKRE